ncbi:nucleotide-binding domain-containing protein [Auriculariales sp. MPI-PUGE-AT-0066]|nr:nucleotide-binding domain-containing protein [Auriculariales sp. MPI-PUGE-AT-0066]
MSFFQDIPGELMGILSRRDTLRKRIESDPGLPVPNPTRSFWMSPLADIREPSANLPDYADVVIIGSGITGASIARTILASTRDKLGADLELKLKVVVLDARDPCGGATGRNGGHIKPGIYEDYTLLKRRHGVAAAKTIIQLRLAHIHETIRVAEKEGVINAADVRETEGIDVCLSEELFQSFKQRFAEWQADAPLQAKGFTVYDADEARKKFTLSDECKGAIVGPAGALSPYTLITSIWKRLSTQHPDHFSLFSHTSVTSISAGPELYTVTTSRGTIQTPHIVHATNSHAGHLLPKMRGKIYPRRATCTAQRPGQAVSGTTQDGRRSWLFFQTTDRYEYVSQKPGPAGEIIVGGGHTLSGDVYGELGVADDSTFNSTIASYLGGVLPTVFGAENWGREASHDTEDKEWSHGRVKATWSGILCMSADGNPWVGRIPPRITQRAAPVAMQRPGRVVTTSPGEWISAAYDGDGMASALMCGRAVAYMILGKEESHGVSGWLPEPFLITEKRWGAVKSTDALQEHD